MVLTKPVIWASVIGTIAGGAAIIKDYCGGKRFDNPITIDNKTVLITGANTGIGKETVRDLAKRNAKIIMACRDMEKCEEARKEIVLETKNKYIYCRKCDLASLESVRQFVDQFKQEHDKLDILINNAGVMGCPQSKTKEGIEMHLGVNHMAHFLLTNLLLDLLKKSAPSRIINVSSITHLRGTINKEDLNLEKNYNFSTAYSQSKLANVLFTVELARRLKDCGVTVYAVHPGLVSTEITRHLSYFNAKISRIVLQPLIWMFIKTPRQGAQTTLYTALEPSLENVSGKYYSNCAESRINNLAEDEDLACWLWAVSEKWTNWNKDKTV